MLQSPSKYSLAELADRFGLKLHGDGKKIIDGVGTLRSATPGQLSFLANPGYRQDLPATRAGAVILKPEDAVACPTNYLLANDPYLAYARLATVFARPANGEPGIHPTAVVDPSAVIGEGACIGAQVFIGARCEIGAGCTVGPGTVIEADSRLDAGCLIHANVSIGQRVRLGQRVIVHAGAVLGADGFGFAFAANHWEKVPQLGGISIGDDCEIGANTTIDRGAIDDTVLEEDVKIDNLVQIAHNVHIGAHSAIAGMAGIAGSSRIGRYCLLAGQSGVSGHVDIADHVTLGAHSVAHHSITEVGSTWSGLIPAQVIRQWQRNLSYLRKLDQLARRLKIVEKRQGKPSNDE